ncbi:MAG TPA: ATP-grasp domain-containing protein [Candidatus Dormibacteraeota bacterium]|nr:ATP-grasp domain-containing protein [Candidatus Dormibacteraeota bacterium]
MQRTLTGMSRRVLLVLPRRTYRARAFLAAARRLGLEVVVGAEEPSTLAPRRPGAEVLVDLGQPEASARRVAAYATTHPLDGVVGVDESAVLVGAHIAERLALPFHPVAAVAATRDKRQLRQRLAAAGVPQPCFRELPGSVAGDSPAAAALLAAVGLPAVVKPVDQAASRGVIRVDTGAEFVAAVDRVRRLLAADPECAGDGPAPLLVEHFAAGPEVAVEGLIRDGHLNVVAIFDKPDPLQGPYFEESCLVTPSRQPSARQAQAVAVAAAAAEALGLIDGPIHAELRWDGAEVRCLEVAARSIGGQCSRALRLVGGATLEEAILRDACGLPPARLELAPGAAGVLMLPIPAAGVLEGVGGQGAARAVPGVEEVTVTIPRGGRLVPLPEGDRYLGFLFARGADAAAVEAALREAHRCLQVRVTEPTGPAAGPPPLLGAVPR